MADKKVAVLFISNEKSNNRLFKEESFQKRFRVFIASDSAKALEILKENKIHVVVTHQRRKALPENDFSDDVLEQLNQPIRVLLTNNEDLKSVRNAVKKGKLFHYLSAPWTSEELSKTIERAYEIYVERERSNKLCDQMVYLNIRLETLIGR